MSEATGQAAVSGSGVSTGAVPGKRVYVPEQTPKQAAKAEPNVEQAPTYKGTKHKVKLDGNETEVDYDELVRGYQKATASDRRFQEANKMASESKEIMSRLESGDVKWLADKLGGQKAKELFEDYLIQQMEFDALPDSEKRARQLESKLSAAERQLKDRDDADKEREKQSWMQKAHDDIDREVSEALKKLGRTPNPRLVIRIVDEMIARANDEAEGWNVDEAAQFAVKGIHQDITDYLGDMPASELVKILPQSVMKAIREHEVNQVLDQRSAKRTKAPEKAGGDRPSKVGIADKFKELEKRFMR